MHLGGTHDVIDIVGNEYGKLSSNMDEIFYISKSSDTLRKGMNPAILPLAIEKIVGQTGLFSLGIATSLGERNSEFKPVKLYIKIDLRLHPAHAEIHAYI